MPISDRMRRFTWSNLWRYVLAGAGCLLLAWFPYVGGRRVPLLGLVDLGFHELGHLLTYVLPDLATAMMGSITQVLVPIGLAIYFFASRRDRAAGAICLAWAAASAYDVAVYIADAPYERLPLIGGEHDWAYILGPEQFDALGGAGTIASTVKVLGLCLLGAAVAICAAAPILERLKDRPWTVRYSEPPPADRGFGSPSPRGSSVSRM